MIQKTGVKIYWLERLALKTCSFHDIISHLLNVWTKWLYLFWLYFFGWGRGVPMWNSLHSGGMNILSTGTSRYTSWSGSLVLKTGIGIWNISCSNRVVLLYQPRYFWLKWPKINLISIEWHSNKYIKIATSPPKGMLVQHRVFLATISI